MNDLISRRAAIDALGEEPEVWSEYDEYEIGCRNQWRDDIDALKAVPPAQQSAQRWIPVSRSLPKQYGSYLVSMLDDAFVYWQVGISTFDTKDNKWSFCDNSFGMKIIAWMPLPEPYKEGEQNG